MAVLRSSSRKGVIVQPQVFSSSSSGRSEFPENVHPSAPIRNTTPGLDVSSKKPSAMNQIDRALWSIERATDLSFANARNTAEKTLSLVSHVDLFPNVGQRLDRDPRATADNFAAIFYSSPVILCIIRLSDYLCVEMNKMYEERTGYCRSEVIGNSEVNVGLWNNVKDRDRVFQKVLAAGRYPRNQTTFQTKAGKLLHIFLSAELMEFRGAPCVLVMAEDITRRRQAEEARLELAQRLVNAQEEECARVGRELHDSIGQSLALLSIELQEAKRALAGQSRASNARFDHLCNKVRDIGQAVGSLSHQLHFLGTRISGSSKCC
jgi:PAS domain S-box-containing protein